jgi:hypothetical protein
MMALVDGLPTSMGIVIVLGNHDRQSQHEVDHACASITLIPRIKVITKPTLLHSARGDLEMLCVPYEPGEAKDWLTTALSELGPLARIPPRISHGRFAGAKAIVLTHLGIWDEATPPFLKATHDSVGLGHVRWLLDAHNLSALYAGNWHERKLWGPQLQVVGSTRGDGPEVGIPGTVCPHNFSDPSGFGHMLIYDSDVNMSRSVLVPGPRFATLCSVAQLESELLKPRNDWGRIYIRVSVERAELQRAVAARATVESSGAYVVQIDVQSSDARTDVREAARAAVAAGDDLSGYADLAAVAEPGTHDGVERRLAAYRKGAG